ncbi:hypothetical protein [Atribacter laminatus]|jgi:hypothetical protein|uniref:Uncharacterized protein n=1 Tax=Atribacter laminatus TaxID=2847778 RepID=A0A7T1F445_ATRLM|nr:hypothetical protein [Atribacter laminatus]QPM69061.1 hypothetical protein RT761_02289 [Atribacter laminatus]
MASIDDREKIVEIVKAFGNLIKEKNKGATSLSIWLLCKRDSFA